MRAPRATRWLAASALALGLSCGLSCRYPATGLMLVIDTDMTQGAGQQLASVRVQVFSQDDDFTLARYDQTFNVGPTAGRTLLPQRLAITPRDNDGSRRVRVLVSAIRRDAAAFEVEARVPFTPGRVGVVPIFLAARCIDAENRACGEGSVCGRSGCEPIERGEAPPYDPDAALERDVLAPPDARSDDAGDEAAADVGGDGRRDTASDEQPGASPDASRSDAASDGATDAGAEASVDAGLDALLDAPIDALADVRSDAGLDALLDAPSADAGLDAGPDARPDGGADATADACTTCDGGACVDLSVAQLHCGACGNRCSATQWCERGRCVAQCPTGQTRCEPYDYCSDLSYDSANCGTCGNRCPRGQPCVGGVCRATGNGLCSTPIDVGLLTASYQPLIVHTERTDTTMRPRCESTSGSAYVSFRLAQRSLVFVENIPVGVDLTATTAVLGYVGTSCTSGDTLLPATSCRSLYCGGNTGGIAAVLPVTSGATRHFVSIDSMTELLPTRVNLHSLAIPSNAPIPRFWSGIGGPQTLAFGPSAPLGCGLSGMSAPTAWGYFLLCPTEDRPASFNVALNNCDSVPGRYLVYLRTSSDDACTQGCSRDSCIITAASCGTPRRFELPRGARGPVLLQVSYLPAMGETIPSALTVTVNRTE